MQIPWLTRPPTAEEVAAHAKAYPVFGTRGLWLWAPPQPYDFVMPASLRMLEVIDGKWIAGDREKDDRAGARWLPCTAEGIPVCFLHGGHADLVVSFYKNSAGGWELRGPFGTTWAVDIAGAVHRLRDLLGRS